MAYANPLKRYDGAYEMNTFPYFDTEYNITKEKYFSLLLRTQPNHMIMGQSCCFTAIMNFQVNFAKRDDLKVALIAPQRFGSDNLKHWNNIFNDNLMSLGYDSLDDLLLDCGWERVEEPEIGDIAWCQTEDDLVTLRPNQPFDKNKNNNGYLYNGTKWIERQPRCFQILVDEEKVKKITANGIYRMVSS